MRTDIEIIDWSIEIPAEQKLKMWGNGPWVAEPDLIKFRYLGLTCLILRSFFKEHDAYISGGSLNGYCEVPKNHPLYNSMLESDVIYDKFDIDVHGGLTFSDKNPDDGFFMIGFDCAHFNDITPSFKNFMDNDPFSKKMNDNLAKLNISPLKKTYKDIDFVTEQCKSMAKQLMDQCKGENCDVD